MPAREDHDDVVLLPAVRRGNMRLPVRELVIAGLIVVLVLVVAARHGSTERAVLPASEPKASSPPIPEAPGSWLDEGDPDEASLSKRADEAARGLTLAQLRQEADAGHSITWERGKAVYKARASDTRSEIRKLLRTRRLAREHWQTHRASYTNPSEMRGSADCSGTPSPTLPASREGVTAPSPTRPASGEGAGAHCPSSGGFS